MEAAGKCALKDRQGCMITSIVNWTKWLSGYPSSARETCVLLPFNDLIPCESRGTLSLVDFFVVLSRISGESVMHFLVG